MEHLTVDAIAKSGGFTGGVVRREVKWKQGGEECSFIVHVRPMSYHTAVNDATNVNGPRPMVVARRLAACLCDAEGAPLFRVSDITGLNDDGTPIMVKNPESGEMEERGAFSANLSNALLAVIGEVSGLGKPMKNSVKQK